MSTKGTTTSYRKLDAPLNIDSDVIDETERSKKRRRTAILATSAVVVVLVIAAIVITTVWFTVIKDNNSSNDDDDDDDDNGKNHGEGVTSCDRKLLMISLDGFRASYLSEEYQRTWNISTPHIDWIRNNGVYVRRLQPRFPSMTFPNHYSIATGLIYVQCLLFSFKFKVRLCIYE